MEKQKLNVKLRKVTGRKVKKLRLEGILPANVFGKNTKSTSIEVSEDEFKKVYKETGETGLIELLMGDKKDGTKAVLVSNVQKDPVEGDIIHVDFRQVDLKEKVSVKVPVELIGESPAEKQGLGTVVLYINEIEVEALPGDLPEKYEIDISELLDVDQSVHVKDLKVDTSKVTIKNDAEEVLVKVEPPQKEEEPEAVVPAAEGEAEVPAEGEETKEGEEKTTPTEEAPVEEKKE